MYIPSTIEDRQKETAHAEFFLMPQIDHAKTVKAGSNIYIDLEFVAITPMGSGANTRVEKRVTDVERGRFPAAYEAFLEGREPDIEGTDLRNWPIISPAQLKTCQGAKVFSVEQLAALNEPGMRSIGMGSQHLVNKAKAYVQAHGGENAKLASDNALIKQDVERLGKRVVELEESLKASQAINRATIAKTGK